MKTSIKSWFSALMGAIFFILLGIFISIAFSGVVHQIDVERYDLVAISGRSLEMIQTDYRHLRDYLWLWHQAPLHLDYFPMSATGVIHFQDVKVFVDSLQWVMLTTLAIFGITFYRFKDWTILDKLWKLMFIIPTTITLLAITQFSRAFVFFHKLIFRNDYWIFSEVTDPVITILPEAFFFHMFLFMVVVVLALGAIIYYISRHGFNQSKKVPH